MSSILFNLVLEKVIRGINNRPQEGVKFQEFSMTVLAYADDMVYMDKTHNSLKSLVSRLEEVAKKVGLQVNEDKT